MEKSEYDAYRDRGDKATLVSGREVDNPLRAFQRISKEPENIETMRRIQIKVHHSGLTVAAPRTVAARSANFESVHFETGSCRVSPKGHPYPWELHVISTLGGTITYRDNFSDRQSGWPDRRGCRYISGAYEMSGAGDAQVMGEVKLAAYGP